MERLGGRVRDAAAVVTGGRSRAATPLAAAVQSELRDLGMPDARIEIALVPLGEIGASGAERPEIGFSAGENQPVLPLAKVASGGELSRAMLALRSVLVDLDDVPTLVFDEVDAGIGGRVAEIVGQMLKKLGKRHQVMCVTHLPQVAASADHQWQVSKGAAKGAVTSRVTVLAADERVEEIARMLGGVKITDTTRRHAAEMLGVKS